MKIGVLSDTHGTLPKAVFKHFKDCDVIWHAGDIGSMEVATQLTAFKPLIAVHGNIDGRVIREQYPRNQCFTCEGVQVLMTHIAGQPPSYTSRVRSMIKKYNPTLLVCGHTHILHIARDERGLIYLNPGAVGHYGIHLVRTLVRFTIEQGRLCDMVTIEIGKKPIA